MSVLALFTTREEAENAVRALEERGFTSEHVGLIGPGDEKDEHLASKLVSRLAEGGTAGIVAGGVLGAMVAGLIPGLGLVVAAGSLIPLVVGVATGGASGLVAAGLLTMAGSPDRALYYEQEVKSGHYLVSVRTDHPEEAREILDAHGAFEAAVV